MPSDFIYFVYNQNEINQLGSLSPAFSRSFLTSQNHYTVWHCSEWLSASTQEGPRNEMSRKEIPRVLQVSALAELYGKACFTFWKCCKSLIFI